MRDAVLSRLNGLAELHLALAESLPAEAFTQRLPSPSNTIGEQFWCVVGARESYLRAMVEGGWAGFSCSLTAEGTRDKPSVLAALRSSSQELIEGLGQVPWDEERDRLLLDLLEHEAQHQGQLIRYIYALGHEFPQGWVERWALD